MRKFWVTILEWTLIFFGVIAISVIFIFATRANAQTVDEPTVDEIIKKVTIDLVEDTKIPLDFVSGATALEKYSDHVIDVSPLADGSGEMVRFIDPEAFVGTNDGNVKHTEYTETIGDTLTGSVKVYPAPVFAEKNGGWFQTYFKPVDNTVWANRPLSLLYTPVRSSWLLPIASAASVTTSPSVGDGEIAGGFTATYAEATNQTPGFDANYTGQTFKVRATDYSSNNFNYRDFIPFNTNGLIGSGTLTSATVNIKRYSSSYVNNCPTAASSSLVITTARQANVTNLVNSDYQLFDFIPKSNYILAASTTASTYSTWTLNDLSIVSSTGYTKLGFTSGFDIAKDSSSCGTPEKQLEIFFYASESGATSSPYLQLNYTPPPPVAPTNSVFDSFINRYYNAIVLVTASALFIGLLLGMIEVVRQLAKNRNTFS